VAEGCDGDEGAAKGVDGGDCEVDGVLLVVALDGSVGMGEGLDLG
jgi:hypothetical protein